LSATDIEVRRLSLVAFGRIGSGGLDALAALQESLEDVDDSAKVLAANAIGAMGRAAQNAVPALMQLSLHENLTVQESARNAIQQICARSDTAAPGAG
jgi:HEAT repeat protein